MIELRDYQKECVAAVDALPDGSRQVVRLATGLGKTAVAANFEFKGRVLWLSHRDELARQPEARFRERGMTFGVEKAGETSDGEDVVSASVQTLSRDARLKKFAPDEFDFVVVDEAHHAAAPTYRKILSYFKPRKTIGLTATPKRADGARLTDSFDGICFDRDLRWGIEHGWLAPIRCLRVTASYDMGRLKKAMGEFTASGLEAEMDGSDDDLVVTKAYLDRCLPEGRPTLVYCPTVKTCERVAATLRAALPEGKEGTVATLSDSTPADERKAILDGFRKGKVECVVNCMILTEGTDLPNASAIVNNRPSANDSLYQQIVGRGTRLHPGKKDCLVIDVVGRNWRAKDVRTAPTLFGLEPDFLPKEFDAAMEKEDLLELVDAVTARRAEEAKNATLAAMAVDFFTQERLSIVEKGAKKGFAAIADAYAKATEAKRPKWLDLDGMVVRGAPDAERRWVAPLSYGGKAWLSEPDEMGKVRLEAYAPAAEIGMDEDLRVLKREIDADEAAAFVRDVARWLTDPRQASKWSLAEREARRGTPATPRQKEAVAKAFAGRVKGRDPFAGLDVTQASDLIELGIELDRMKKKKAEAEAAARDAAKKRKGAALEKWKREKRLEAEAAARRERRVEEASDAAMARARAEIERRKAAAAAEEARYAAKEGKAETFKVGVDARWIRRSAGRATDKQLGYLSALADAARAGGKAFDLDPALAGASLDSSTCGALVSYVKAVSERPRPPIGWVERHASSKFLLAARALRRGEGTAWVECECVAARRA